MWYEQGGCTTPEEEKLFVMQLLTIEREKAVLWRRAYDSEVIFRLEAEDRVEGYKRFLREAGILHPRGHEENQRAEEEFQREQEEARQEEERRSKEERRRIQEEIQREEIRRKEERKLDQEEIKQEEVRKRRTELEALRKRQSEELKEQLKELGRYNSEEEEADNCEWENRRQGFEERMQQWEANENWERSVAVKAVWDEALRKPKPPPPGFEEPTQPSKAPPPSLWDNPTTPKAPPKEFEESPTQHKFKEAPDDLNRKSTLQRVAEEVKAPAFKEPPKNSPPPPSSIQVVKTGTVLKSPPSKIQGTTKEEQGESDPPKAPKAIGPRPPPGLPPQEVVENPKPPPGSPPSSPKVQPKKPPPPIAPGREGMPNQPIGRPQQSYIPTGPPPKAESQATRPQRQRT